MRNIQNGQHLTAIIINYHYQELIINFKRMLLSWRCIYCFKWAIGKYLYLFLYIRVVLVLSYRVQKTAYEFIQLFARAIKHCSRHMSSLCKRCSTNLAWITIDKIQIKTVTPSHLCNLWTVRKAEKLTVSILIAYIIADSLHTICVFILCFNQTNAFLPSPSEAHNGQQSSSCSNQNSSTWHFMQIINIQLDEMWQQCIFRDVTVSD